MAQFKTKNDYINQFQVGLDQIGEERKVLTIYLNTQFRKLDQLIESLSQYNFWENYPKILGIDAKLTLMTELISFKDFSNEEIIRMVENDYSTYFKELCGYDRSKEPNHSMIFNVV
ncbi:DUF7006 family protein [Enterococcus mundtii]